MGVDAGTPPGLFERIRQMVRDEVAKLLRSGLLRSASIGEGGLTLRGGFFRMRNAADTSNAFYIGAVTPAQPDGTPQPGWIVRRADGTNVLLLRDAFPENGPDGVHQALSWLDRTGNTVLADDTDSGQGLARPYVPIVFYRSRNSDWPTVTGGDWQTVYRAKAPKQQPRLLVRAFAGATDGSTSGELRVMINGTQHGSTQAVVGATVGEFIFGPDAVAGSHMSDLSVEIQARVTAGTGGIRVSPSQGEGRQS
ncbi:hypothetical protein [Blastococcus mobilis]|uniref:Uncharacterized protein n=1 Tax=Blastococcus mobilis TaxID=1938746 RepID=A0A238VG37_9ACTN|nr:hypothetical protein [Blastococcus mobilis]SNR33161.1 hypothetical protein SAMN06272737_10398 [Blastococcus mobilis]